MGALLASSKMTVDVLNRAPALIGGATALHVASQFANLEVVDRLLGCSGVQVDPMMGRDESTPLMIAIYLASQQEDYPRVVQHLEVAERLLLAGASLTAPPSASSRTLRGLPLVASSRSRISSL